jgi:hypothetical protein
MATRLSTSLEDCQGKIAELRGIGSQQWGQVEDEKWCQLQRDLQFWQNYPSPVRAVSTVSQAPVGKSSAAKAR